MLAYQAPPEFLARILPALIERCDEDEGWIVSRAAIRLHEAGLLGPDSLEAIKGRWLASYTYVCAMTETPISHDEALDIVRTCTSSDWHNGRGLVIWSIGRLGMRDTLDRIREIAPELLEADEAARRSTMAAEMRRFGLWLPTTSDKDDPE